MRSAEDERAALEQRLDAYLDGLLSHAETRATERMLVDPTVAAALAEAIALRELLQSAAPADATPDGLSERIIVALGIDDEEAATPSTTRVSSRLGRARGALYGASWMVRGPSSGRVGRAALSSVGAVLGQRDDEPEPSRAARWWSALRGGR